MRFVNFWCTLKGLTLWKMKNNCHFQKILKKNNVCMQISFFERLKSVRNDLKLSLHSPMVSLKKKSESLIKYYIKVTCVLKGARKLTRKTETYESAKCVPCNTRKCTHNGFVSDRLKWALKGRFYATGPWFSQKTNRFWILKKCISLQKQNCCLVFTRPP